MTITLGDLKAAGACIEALEAFAKAFPEGAPSVAAIGWHPACKPKWRGWMAVHMPQCDRETGLVLLEYSNGQTWRDSYPHNFWHGMAAAKAHWCDRETGLRLIEESHNPSYWRPLVVTRAHWCDRETAMSLIEDADTDGYWRAAVEARFAV